MPELSPQPGAYQQIQLSNLVPSKTNYRKTFDKAGLEELAESIRAHGVLQALVVRAVNGKDAGGGRFEIVAGERRFRAAKLAKLDTVPVIVRELTDAAAREIQLIENVQREGIHPLDEGLGYAELMKVGQQTAPDVAAKVGKSLSYVYQRLKLAELIPEAQQAFREGRISAGHAVPIARLQPTDQVRALLAVFGIWEGQGAKALKDPEATASATQSVRDCLRWIAEHVNLDLTKAPFPAADNLLVKAAGSCTVCPKRAGTNPELFPDVKKGDTCTDPACYQSKVAAWVQIQVAEATEKDGAAPLRLSTDWVTKTKGVLPRDKYHVIEKKADHCPAMRRGVCVEGDRIGQTAQVCADPKCKKHKAAPANAGDAAYQEREAKLKKKIKLHTEIRRQIISRIITATTRKPEREDLNLAAAALFARLDYATQKRLSERRGWKPAKRGKSWYAVSEYGGDVALQRIARLEPGPFNQLLADMALADAADVNRYAHKLEQLPPLLVAYARRAKVNTAAVARQVTADQSRDRKRAAKEPAKEAKTKVAKPSQTKAAKPKAAARRKAAKK